METEYLGDQFMEAAQIDKQRKDYIGAYGDIIFLKKYESDVFDHHLATIMYKITMDFPLNPNKEHIVDNADKI
jgi:hypothetical protein